ncbi:MAG: hypothetical protein R3Y13_02020 [bacterium]
MAKRNLQGLNEFKQQLIEKEQDIDAKFREVTSLVNSLLENGIINGDIADRLVEVNSTIDRMNASFDEEFEKMTIGLDKVIAETNEITDQISQKFTELLSIDPSTYSWAE